MGFCNQKESLIYSGATHDLVYDNTMFETYETIEEETSKEVFCKYPIL